MENSEKIDIAIHAATVAEVIKKLNTEKSVDIAEIDDIKAALIFCLGVLDSLNIGVAASDVIEEHLANLKK